MTRLKSVYGRLFGALSTALLGVAIAALALPAGAQAQGMEGTVLDARDAFRKKDRGRLALARATAAAERNPLAMWVDYWELTNRLADAQQDELDAFAARWNGTYVEDRLRNDWLLELGRRRDWRNFAAEFPRFRMNDDREATCYALLVDQLNGKVAREAALDAWLAQRDADEGCALMASTLFEAGRFTAEDAWRKARSSVDAGRPRAVRLAVLLARPGAEKVVDDVIDNPALYLVRSASTESRANAELATLALMRMAASDPGAAAAQLDARWERSLPADLATWAWSSVAKQAAMKLQPEASDWFLRAARMETRTSPDMPLPDETLAWKVRSALRADNGKPRWQQVVQAVNAMSPAEQKDPAWVYWKARALQVLAKDSQDGESLRKLSRELLASLAGQLNFYGSLAAEDTSQPFVLPLAPAPLTPAEIGSARVNSGLVRSLQLISIGLRGEGVREWNYTLRGMGDRELLAAAQLACDREVWDRCINTSERTRSEVDMAQRFPMPFRNEVSMRAREIGLDPAYVYGLIRQESRFVMDARSGVGASGLMQIMPATARWTAKKIGVAYSPGQLADRDTNVRLGTAYLKLVLDDFGGSQVLATAAYNAGPGRSRKWREGPWLDPAAWAENIPFPETRDYVKKVLSNATYYAALMGSPGAALKPRLGRPIGPAEPTLPTDKDLP
ncbi:MAG: transglycosylase SLT domain-containing protein [Caldimonas sp.]